MARLKAGVEPLRVMERTGLVPFEDRRRQGSHSGPRTPFIGPSLSPPFRSRAIRPYPGPV